MFDDMGFDEGTYDMLQACENGHLVTERLEEYPERGQKFCKRCGSKTISSCLKCGTPIRGHFRGNMVGGWDDDDVPAFCHDCGKPYPWTSARVTAAQALAEEVEGLTDAERVTLKSSIEEIVADGPMTEVAAVRVKKMMPKILSGGGEVFRKMVVDIASSTAAKVLKGG